MVALVVLMEKKKAVRCPLLAVLVLLGLMLLVVLFPTIREAAAASALFLFSPPLRPPCRPQKTLMCSGLRLQSTGKTRTLETSLPLGSG
jgi:hypothetical protein